MTTQGECPFLCVQASLQDKIPEVKWLSLRLNALAILKDVATLSS